MKRLTHPMIFFSLGTPTTFHEGYSTKKRPPRPLSCDECVTVEKLAWYIRFIRKAPSVGPGVSKSLRASLLLCFSHYSKSLYSEKVSKYFWLEISDKIDRKNSRYFTFNIFLIVIYKYKYLWQCKNTSYDEIPKCQCKYLFQTQWYSW